VVVVAVEVVVGGRVGGREGGRPKVCILRGGFQGWYARYRKEMGMVVPCEEG
jgi:hypothetical protein